MGIWLPILAQSYQSYELVCYQPHSECVFGLLEWLLKGWMKNTFFVLQILPHSPVHKATTLGGVLGMQEEEEEVHYYEYEL